MATILIQSRERVPTLSSESKPVYRVGWIPVSAGDGNFPSSPSATGMTWDYDYTIDDWVNRGGSNCQIFFMN